MTTTLLEYLERIVTIHASEASFNVSEANKLSAGARNSKGP